MKLDEKLLKKYNQFGNERIGFVLADGTLVDIKNKHSSPDEGASASSTDLFKYMFSGEFEVIATWHTHPSKPCNLSGEDYRGFLAYPDIAHYIIGEDGLAKFIVEDGVVKNVND